MHYRENQKIACELSVELVNNRVLYMKTYTSHNGLRRELAMRLIGDVETSLEQLMKIHRLFSILMVIRDKVRPFLAL